MPKHTPRNTLLAKTVVLEEESTDRFLDLLVAYTNEYQPQTASQISLVETMAVARWRQLRIWGAQKTAMDRDMALQDPSVGPASVRALTALRGSTESSCPPELLLRYETVFDHQFSRALTRLLVLQSRKTVKPMAPYHPQSPAGQTWKEEISPPAKRTPEVIENNAAAKETSPIPGALPALNS